MPRVCREKQEKIKEKKEWVLQRLRRAKEQKARAETKEFKQRPRGSLNMEVSLEHDVLIVMFR